MNDNLTTYTALIAEDEPILAESLKKELAKAWPNLCVQSVVSNGTSALEHLQTNQTDVAFLDISMPGLTGLQVAESLSKERELNSHSPLPIIVFVTAYEEHAIDAFEIQALDYVRKPVTAERLTKTVDRIKEQLIQKNQIDLNEIAKQLDKTIRQVPNGQRPLTSIRAATGNTTHLISTEDIIYFEAADKYVNVVTHQGEAIIREPLKKLLTTLDSTQFQQIHRSYIVNMQYVISAEKLEDAKLLLNLKDCSEQLPVSRAYSHLFKPM